MSFWSQVEKLRVQAIVMQVRQAASRERHSRVAVPRVSFKPKSKLPNIGRWQRTWLAIW